MILICNPVAMALGGTLTVMVLNPTTLRRILGTQPFPGPLLKQGARMSAPFLFHWLVAGEAANVGVLTSLGVRRFYESRI